MEDKIINGVIFNQKRTRLNSKYSIIFNKIENNEYSYDKIIINELAKKLDIPCVNELAFNYVPDGYAGLHLTDLLTKLLEKANGDINLAQKGIVLLDDINVLYEINSSINNTILHKELPELINGNSYEFLYNGKKVKFDTTNVTIMASGNFSKISEEQMKPALSTNRKFKYLGGFQEFIDISSITLNKNDIVKLFATEGKVK